MGLSNWQPQFLGELPEGHALKSSMAYLSTSENRRVDRLRALKLLFAGFHREFYLHYGYTQFSFPQVLRHDGQLVTMYVPLNLLTLVSLKMADLLVGESPTIRSDDDSIQDALDALADRSRIQAGLHSSATELSWAGETCVEIIRRDGQSYITHTPVQNVFPQGVARPDGQYDAYHVYATANIGSETAPIWLLLQTRYERGLILRECWQLSGRFGARERRVDIKSWPVPVIEREDTGLGRPSLVWITNGAPGEPSSDYEPLVSLQDQLNAKQTQLARVFMKHADPKLYMASMSAGQDGNVRASDDVIFGDSPDAMPKYITWESQSAAAMADRDFALQVFCVAAEIPPALLGIKNDATAESARKMRLSASTALAKAARRAAAMKPAVVLALQLAIELDGGPRGASVSVEMRDGLPNDDQERADVIASLRSSGTLSVEGALELRGLDAEAITKEKARLAEEAKAAMPNTLLGDPGNRTDSGGQGLRDPGLNADTNSGSTDVPSPASDPNAARAANAA